MELWLGQSICFRKRDQEAFRIQQMLLRRVKELTASLTSFVTIHADIRLGDGGTNI